MSKRQPPFSLRLTFEERQRLVKDAGGESLSAYVKDRLFGDDMPRKKRRKSPVTDTVLLSKLLAQLGASRIKTNLDHLAQSADSGILHLMPDTEKQITRACEDVSAMRFLLMQALGQRAPDQLMQPKQSLSQTFAGESANVLKLTP
jgi:hypothetical protein